MAPPGSERYDHEDYHMIAPSIEPFNDEQYPTFLLGDEMETSMPESIPSLTHQRSPGKSIDDLEESLFESFPETHTWEEHPPQSCHGAPHSGEVDANQAYMDPKHINPSLPLTHTDVTNQLPSVEAAAHSRAGPAHPTHHPSAPTGSLCCPECQKSFRRPTEYK